MFNNMTDADCEGIVYSMTDRLEVTLLDECGNHVDNNILFLKHFNQNGRKGAYTAVRAQNVAPKR